MAPDRQEESPENLQVNSDGIMLLRDGEVVEYVEGRVVITDPNSPNGRGYTREISSAELIADILDSGTFGNRS